MKLIYCPLCHDVVKLTKSLRSCECGKASGLYLENGMNAEINGPAVPIGFHNISFLRAVQQQPHAEGRGVEFTAFCIPDTALTIDRIV